MLKFFREKAHVVGWTIVIFFVATMFAGSLFMMNQSSDVTKRDEAIRSENTFVSLGNYPLEIYKFNQLLQSNLLALYQTEGRISPLQSERITLMAFNVVIEDMAYFIGAQKNDVSLSKIDKKGMLKEFLFENDLKSKKELKKVLKENGVEYKFFLSQIERDMVIRKFKNSLIDYIFVDQDKIDASFKEIMLNRISVFYGDQISDDQLEASLLSIQSDLNEGIDFEVLKKQYEGTLDLNLEVSNDWSNYFVIDSQLRDELFSQQVGSWSKPFFLDNRYELLLVKDEKLKTKPDDFNEADYSEKLLNALRQEQIDLYMIKVFEENPIQIYSPDILAIYSKSIGDVDSALGAYQELATNFPESSIPHFFRADLFNQINNKDKMFLELQKADLKSELSVQNDFPELHFFYGDMLVEENRLEEALAQYKKTFALIQDNLLLLNLLKSRYVNLDYVDGIQNVESQISVIEEQNPATEQGEKLIVE